MPRPKTSYGGIAMTFEEWRNNNFNYIKNYTTYTDEAMRQCWNAARAASAEDIEELVEVLRHFLCRSCLDVNYEYHARRLRKILAKHTNTRGMDNG